MCVFAVHRRNRELYSKRKHSGVLSLSVCERLTIFFLYQITTLEINATVCNNMRDLDPMRYMYTFLYATNNKLRFICNHILLFH